MQLKKVWCSKGFREYVCDLLLYRNVLQAKDVILDVLSNEIHVHLNVLHALVLN